MTEMNPQSRVSSVEERARNAVTSTLIGAALMLFFGYVYLARPSGDDLFSRAATVLFYTLRIGGLAFVAVAAWLYIRQPAAFIVDAILAFIVGAILILCGVAMLMDQGDVFNSIILVVCGLTFFPSGMRSARDYAFLKGGGRKAVV